MITPLPSPFGERDLHKCFIMLCVYLNLQAIKREPLQKQHKNVSNLIGKMSDIVTLTIYTY